MSFDFSAEIAGTTAEKYFKNFKTHLQVIRTCIYYWNDVNWSAIGSWLFIFLSNFFSGKCLKYSWKVLGTIELTCMRLYFAFVFENLQNDLLPEVSR